MKRPSIFVNRKKPCAYVSLMVAGMPALPALQFMPGHTTRERASNWLSDNWMHHPRLQRFLISITGDDGYFKISTVSSPAAQEAMYGVIDFCERNHSVLEHMRSILAPKTLAGTPAPVVSKMFNNMSYAERQEALKNGGIKAPDTPSAT